MRILTFLPNSKAKRLQLLSQFFAAILSLALAINGAVNYTYDPVGNRKQLTSTLAPVPTGLWYYDANDRFTAGDTYDADGNTVSSGGIANGYDFENHLIQKGGVTIVYDGEGNRVSKTVAGVTTTYLVDSLNPTGYAQVVYESFSGSSSGNRELNHSYVYGLELISQTRSYVANFQGATQKIYCVYDGHGSVRALTGPTGAITDTYDYDAFGNLLHSTTTLASPTPNNYLFAGEQFDPDLDLYYNRARYLNVSTGRFWTMDTDEGDKQVPQSLHKYLFASGDPVNSVDPSGHDDFSIVGVAAASAVAAVIEVAAYFYIDQRIASSVGPFPLPTQEYFKVYGALATLISHLNAGCGSCDSTIFQKVGVTRSDFAAYLSAGAGFYDATKTNTTLEEAGLADKNDRVSDYFKSDSADAATRPSYSPPTTYWDPAYISSNGSQYLGGGHCSRGAARIYRHYRR